MRQAELSYNVAQLEYEQLQQQYANEKEVLRNTKVQELGACSKRHWPKPNVRSTMRRCVRPEGHPTYINNQIGAQVPEGSQIAVISDLSHFKVEGEMPILTVTVWLPAARPLLKIGGEKLEGSVSSLLSAFKEWRHLLYRYG